MNLEYLRYFQTVAEHGNMTAAAEELFLSQSTLSKALKKLSEELGYPLYTVRNRRFKLTENGELLLSYSHEILDTLDEIEKHLEKQHQATPEYVHIDTRVGLSFMNQVNMSFAQTYPQIKYIIYNHQQIAPRQQDYDLTISSLVGSQIPEDRLVLFQEKIYLALPDTHPLSAQGEIHLEDLAGENFLRLTPNYQYQHQLDSWLNRREFLPAYAAEVDDYTNLFAMVEAGLGLAFVPTVTWGDCKDYRIVLRPISGESPIRTITIESTGGKKLSSAARLYWDFVRRYFENAGLTDFQ